MVGKADPKKQEEGTIWWSITGLIILNPFQVFKNLLVYINCTKGFHHGILHMHILHFHQINPFYCSLLSPSHSPSKPFLCRTLSCFNLT
jgi:hypothetical protein